MRWWKHGTPDDPKVPTPLERIRASTRIDPETGCRVWTRYIGPAGYPLISVGRRRLLVHRVAWEAEVGPIPEGLCVLHRCDNPLCSNVDHLFIGDQATNLRDAAAKGRLHAEGRHHTAKMTVPEVTEIRRLWAEGGLSQSKIAAQFGCTQTLVSQIVRRVIWRHLP